MRRRGIVGVVTCIAWLLSAGAGWAQSAPAQPASEGHPSKWQTLDKSLFDLVSDGYRLVSVAYDTSQTGPGAEPDVHYFLAKDTTVAKCDFRKRGETSFYWCYQLAKAGQ